MFQYQSNPLYIFYSCTFFYILQRTFIANTFSFNSNAEKKEEETNIYKLGSHRDDVIVTTLTALPNGGGPSSTELFTSTVSTSSTGNTVAKNKGGSGDQDELFPMYIISKDVVCAENQTDTWNMVGSYDVEESGTLVPFDSDEDKLFSEHFQ